MYCTAANKIVCQKSGSVDVSKALQVDYSGGSVNIVASPVLPYRNSPVNGSPHR
jgi:hypothetical protein